VQSVIIFVNLKNWINLNLCLRHVNQNTIKVGVFVYHSALRLVRPLSTPGIRL
jgi:hypothetical protein